MEGSSCAGRHCRSVARGQICGSILAVLHQVIALHLEAFLDAVADVGDGAGLPQVGGLAIVRDATSADWDKLSL